MTLLCRAMLLLFVAAPFTLNAQTGDMVRLTDFGVRP